MTEKKECCHKIRNFRVSYKEKTLITFKAGGIDSVIILY